MQTLIKKNQNFLKPNEYKWDFILSDHDNLVLGFRIITNNYNNNFTKKYLNSYELTLHDLKDGNDCDKQMYNAIVNYNKLKLLNISPDDFEEATFFFENHYVPLFIYGENVIHDLIRFNNKIKPFII